MKSLPTLYELAAEYRADLDRLSDLDLDENTLSDTLEGMQWPVEQKATQVSYVIRNLEALAAQIKDAEQQMAARRKAIESRAERVREYLRASMQACGMTKIESPHFSITLRQNPPKVVVDDPEAVPLEYWRQPPLPDPELDKKAMAEAMKAGEVIEGARLERCVSVVIK